MSFTRGLMLSALCGLCLAAWPVAVDAQFYESERQALDFSPDPTARSPRLMGMGRLSLLSDVHGHVNFWDFAGNPIGILDADTSSVFELRPVTSSTASRHIPTGGTRERQDLAGREIRMGFEAWLRSTETAYGFYGDFASLRSDRPFDAGTARRVHFDEPRAAAALNGRMPRFQSERMRYALHAFYESESEKDEFLTLFSNDEGDYLGRGGEQLPPPNFFDPDEHRVSTLGGGVDFSYRVAPWASATAGFVASSSRIEGENTSLIHSTGTGEDRPYYTFRVGLIGTIASRLEYGAETRNWTSSSEERFVFTLKAGQNQDPFTGRGKVLDREEDGRETRGRLRWTWGNLEANAGGRSWTREANISPPLPGDLTSYNYFLNTAVNRDGADSLALPDSVRRSVTEESGWELAYGASWRIAGGKGLLGFESHVRKLEAEDRVFLSPVASDPDLPDFASLGPDRKTWDLRGGLEYPCTPALTGRLGYIYRWDDRDENTDRSEFTSNTLTAGLGLRPAGSAWIFDLAWAGEWVAPDFDDATESKASRQQVAAQVRWAF